MKASLVVDSNKCTGCRSCQVVCSLAKEGMVWPEKSRVRITTTEGQGLVSFHTVVCEQCDPPICAEECPVEAIYRDTNTGALMVREADCNGCGACVSVCPVGAIIMDTKKGTAVKCDLCGGIPLCVDICQPGALKYVRANDS